MRKVIYLIGVSGSGKTTIAQEFSGRTHVVNLDQLVLVTAMRLCPFCKPGAAGDWELWKALLKYTAAIEALHFSFLQSFSDCLSSQKPIIFEGTILVWDLWRDALCASLEKAGLRIESETFLWLDPSPDQVRRNMVSRGRGKERSMSLAQIDELCNRYADLAVNPAFDRLQGGELLKRKIQLVLGFDGADI